MRPSVGHKVKINPHASGRRISLLLSIIGNETGKIYSIVGEYIFVQFFQHNLPVFENEIEIVSIFEDKDFEFV